MLCTGYFKKIAKVNSQQEKPICPNRKKLVPAKHKKSPIRKNKLRQKFRATRCVPISVIIVYQPNLVYVGLLRRISQFEPIQSG